MPLPEAICLRMATRTTAGEFTLAVCGWFHGVGIFPCGTQLAWNRKMGYGMDRQNRILLATRSHGSTLGIKIGDSVDE